MYIFTSGKNGPVFYEKLLSNILLISFSQGFIVAMFVALGKYYKSRRVRLLTAMVMLLSLNTLQAWIHLNHIRLPVDILNYVFVPWFFLLMPYFYLFIRAFTGEFRPAKMVLWVAYGFVFIFFFITLILYFPYKNNISKLRYLLWDINRIAEIFGLIFNWSVLISAYRFYRKNKSRFNRYSNIRWLKISFVLTHILFIIWFLAIISTYFFGNRYTFDHIYNTLRAASAIIIYWIVYTGIYRFSITRENAEKNDKEADFMDEEMKRECEKFMQIILEKELYTDEMLSLKSLAQYLNISPKRLSKMISCYSGKNFTEFINDLRVEKAKKLLLDPEYDRYSLSVVALDSGFNSRSRFYTHFKRVTGMTPAEFKKQARFTRPDT